MKSAAHPYGNNLLAGTNGTFVGAMGQNGLQNFLPANTIPYRLGVIGTSLQQMGNVQDATGIQSTAAGWLNWAQVLTDNLFYAPVWIDTNFYPGWEPNGSGTRGFRGYNAGVNGQKFAQIMARKEYFVDTYNADIIIFDMGTNDIGISTKEDIQSAREELADYYTSNGKRVIFLPILMRGVVAGNTWVAGGTGRKEAAWCNNKTRIYCLNNPNAYFYDWNNAWIDFTNLNGDPKSGYSYDGTHLSTIGAYYVGKDFAAWLKTIFPSVMPSVWSNDDQFNAVSNPLGNIFTNPFLITSGGTLATGATGTVANLLIGDRTGTGTATCAFSLVPRADGRGNWQQLNIDPTTSTATSTTVLRTSNTLTHGLNTGDWYQLSAKVNCVTPGGVTDLVLYHQDKGISGTISKGMMTTNLATVGNLPNEAWSGTIVCPPIQVASGSTNCRFQLQLNSSINGAAAVYQIGSIELRKVDNPIVATSYAVN